ncbi:Uncharacterised protein [Vibrio cholerae]|nr:Uncharacterised protein [Vibrio cholerae]
MNFHRWQFELFGDFTVLDRCRFINALAFHPLSH